MKLIMNPLFPDLVDFSITEFFLLEKFTPVQRYNRISPMI